MKPLFLSFLISSSLFAADVASLTKQELPSLVALYKELHANPELSMHEVETAALVAKAARSGGSAGNPAATSAERCAASSGGSCTAMASASS